MLQLFIDTATEKSFIGLSFRGELIEMVSLPLGLRNSKLLFSHLMELLTRQRLTPKDLHLIGCGIGPGSYTGIRVGASAAQSMAYALKLPLVGLSSLQSYRPSKPGPFMVLFDAKYGGVYAIRGEFDGVDTHFEGRPEVLSLEEVPLQGLTVVTPHLKDLQPKLSIACEEGVPSGELFAKQIEELYQKNDYTTNGALKLLYLRKTQAEIEKRIS